LTIRQIGAAMQLPLYQVDAFTSRRFAGNPAAVCPLERWLPDDVMQAIAAENNLAETAFFVPRGDDFELRWFTPAVEVDLCGHATLATGFVLMTELDPKRRQVVFHTRSGPLTVRRDDGTRLTMDFPAQPPKPIAPPAGLVEALGARPTEVLLACDTFLVAVYERATEVRALAPDLAAIARLDYFGVTVTARGTDADADVDFVSRFFAPARGVPEDPVTGSSHCRLVPLWAARLGKSELRARQVSVRSGELACRLDGDRVRMTGDAVLVLTGTLHL
jgi:PhzF family phenazine biosynthesis protein